MIRKFIASAERVALSPTPDSDIPHVFFGVADDASMTSDLERSKHSDILNQPGQSGNTKYYGQTQSASSSDYQNSFKDVRSSDRLILDSDQFRAGDEAARILLEGGKVFEVNAVLEHEEGEGKNSGGGGGESERRGRISSDDSDSSGSPISSATQRLLFDQRRSDYSDASNASSTSPMSGATQRLLSNEREPLFRNGRMITINPHETDISSSSAFTAAQALLPSPPEPPCRNGRRSNTGQTHASKSKTHHRLLLGQRERSYSDNRNNASATFNKSLKSVGNGECLRFLKDDFKDVFFTSSRRNIGENCVLNTNQDLDQHVVLNSDQNSEESGFSLASSDQTEFDFNPRPTKVRDPFTHVPQHSNSAHIDLVHAKSKSDNDFNLEPEAVGHASAPYIRRTDLAHTKSMSTSEFTSGGKRGGSLGAEIPRAKSLSVTEFSHSEGQNKDFTRTNRVFPNRSSSKGLNFSDSFSDFTSSGRVMASDSRKSSNIILSDVNNKGFSPAPSTGGFPPRESTGVYPATQSPLESAGVFQSTQSLSRVPPTQSNGLFPSNQSLGGFPPTDESSFSSELVDDDKELLFDLEGLGFGDEGAWVGSEEGDSLLDELIDEEGREKRTVTVGGPRGVRVDGLPGNEKGTTTTGRGRPGIARQTSWERPSERDRASRFYSGDLNTRTDHRSLGDGHIPKCQSEGNVNSKGRMGEISAPEIGTRINSCRDETSDDLWEELVERHSFREQLGSGQASGQEVVGMQDNARIASNNFDTETWEELCLRESSQQLFDVDRDENQSREMNSRKDEQRLPAQEVIKHKRDVIENKRRLPLWDEGSGKDKDKDQWAQNPKHDQQGNDCVDSVWSDQRVGHIPRESNDNQQDYDDSIENRLPLLPQQHRDIDDSRRFTVDRSRENRDLHTPRDRESRTPHDRESRTPHDDESREDRDSQTLRYSAVSPPNRDSRDNVFDFASCENREIHALHDSGLNREYPASADSYDTSKPCETRETGEEKLHENREAIESEVCKTHEDDNMSPTSSEHDSEHVSAKFRLRRLLSDEIHV
jgi:hypothetical protein